VTLTGSTVSGNSAIGYGVGGGGISGVNTPRTTTNRKDCTTRIFGIMEQAHQALR
jgi:hypothetical protein